MSLDLPEVELVDRQDRKTELTKGLDTYTQRLRLSRTLYAIGAVCVGIGLWVGYLCVMGWLYTSEVFSSHVPVVQPKYGDSLFWFLSKEGAAQHPLLALGMVLVPTIIGVAALFFGFRTKGTRTAESHVPSSSWYLISS